MLKAVLREGAIVPLNRCPRIGKKVPIWRWPRHLHRQWTLTLGRRLWTNSVRTVPKRMRHRNAILLTTDRDFEALTDLPTDDWLAKQAP